MKNPNKPCIFCNPKKKDIIFETSLVYATFDSYPVSNFHALIITKRHIKNFFKITNKELLDCKNLIIKLKRKIISKDKLIKGFNIGTNSGKYAGQSVNHFHIHLIPRRKGDVKNPQGGVRSVIPLKQHYIRKNK